MTSSKIIHCLSKYLLLSNPTLWACVIRLEGLKNNQRKGKRGKYIYIALGIWLTFPGLPSRIDAILAQDNLQTTFLGSVTYAYRKWVFQDFVWDGNNWMIWILRTGSKGIQFELGGRNGAQEDTAACYSFFTEWLIRLGDNYKMKSYG